MPLPTIAVTTGDPAGIGPEVALRAVSEVTEWCEPLLIGNRAACEQVAERLRIPFPDVPFWNLGEFQRPVEPGRVEATYGRASFDYVCAAIDKTLAGEVTAMVTGPIQKEAWHAASIPFPGHTELLAERTGASDVRMMLTAETISCILATVHVGYADVPALLTVGAILKSIRMAHETISKIRGREARVTVCGLNPHAGEHGLFGNGEEERIILPAIQQAAREGIAVTGPLPPDTAFTIGNRRQTDVYVCMYHDQGLIPLKTLAFDDAVNVTLGLPIVRTSVDHGTAMDIAWQGIASHHSMVEAIRLAVQLQRL